jgi:hypothetical protein
MTNLLQQTALSRQTLRIHFSQWPATAQQKMLTFPPAPPCISGLIFLLTLAHWIRRLKCMPKRRKNLNTRQG